MKTLFLMVGTFLCDLSDLVYVPAVSDGRVYLFAVYRLRQNNTFTHG